MIDYQKKVYDKLMSSGSDRAYKRYLHSLSVAKECCELVRRFNLPIDLEKAYLTGLVHDYAKFETLEKFKKIASKYAPEFDFANNSNKVLHALLGGYIVKDELSLDDEICEAIRTHSTGGKNMSLLGEVVFLADYTEETREIPTCIAVREISKKNFYKAIAYALESQIQKVLISKDHLNEETNEAFEKYKKYLKDGEN